MSISCGGQLYRGFTEPVLPSTRTGSACLVIWRSAVDAVLGAGNEPTENHPLVGKLVGHAYGVEYGTKEAWTHMRVLAARELPNLDGSGTTTVFWCVPVEGEPTDPPGDEFGARWYSEYEISEVPTRLPSGAWEGAICGMCGTPAVTPAALCDGRHAHGPWVNPEPGDPTTEKK